MTPLYEPRDKKLGDLLENHHNASYRRKHGWKYYHLFTSLLLKRLHTKQDGSKGWSVVSTKKLRSLYGQLGKEKVRLHQIIRRDMVAWGVLMQHTTQETKIKRVSRYKIRDERMAAGFVRADVMMPRALQAAPTPVVKLKGIHGKLQSILLNDLHIDTEAATSYAEWARGTSMKLKDKAIDWKYLKKTGDWSKFRNRVVTDEIFSKWLYHIDRLTHPTGRYTHDANTNRAFTPVTAAPDSVRRFLLLRGKPVAGVDVSCCQPLLFTALVREYCELMGMDEVPDDVVRWQQYCEEPDEANSIYPFLHAKLIAQNVKLNCHQSVHPVSKARTYNSAYTKAFKVEFFAEVFFSKDKNSEVRRVFAEHFPTISKAITHYKQDKSLNLPVRLQRMEAVLLLETVCPVLLAKKIKVVTVHDELLCQTEHSATVAAEIRKAFLLIHGLAPVIKIKHLHT